ncbi:MAG: hypothetical protein V4627_05145 [Pseudomonadota bacterium]
MKPFRVTSVLLASAFLACCGRVHAKPAQLPVACQTLIAKSFPSWKPVEPAADVVAWAKSQKFNPVIAVGDFDENGQSDWAIIGADGKKGKVVLCLSQGTKIVLAVAEDDGCTDLIYSLGAKAKVFNNDTGKDEVLKRDSVATLCFEKSGRVFSLENGKFRVFFNSD